MDVARAGVGRGEAGRPGGEVAPAGEGSWPAAAHLVGAVATVLVHADAFSAALHLGLLAAVCWGEGGAGRPELGLTKTFPTHSLT